MPVKVARCFHDHTGWFNNIKVGGFPAPIKMGRSSRWLKSEVEAWLQARIAQSRP